MSATIISLPTAAPRKVRQSTARKAREAAKSLPRLPYIAPDVREAMADARRIMNPHPQTAERLLLAMFSRLSDHEKTMVELTLCLDAHKIEPAADALAVVRSQTCAPWRSLALSKAMEIVREGGDQ